MRRLFVMVALAGALAACDDPIPPDALVCARAVANYHLSFNRDMWVVGLPKSDSVRIVDYQVEPADPDRPGRRRASCKLRTSADDGRPQITYIAYDVENEMVAGNSGGSVLQDVHMANMVPGGPGNLGFDVPGLKPLIPIASPQGRCPDTADLATKTIAFHGLDAKTGGCIKVDTAPLAETPCRQGLINAYDGSNSAWSYVDRAQRTHAVVNCVSPDRFQRQLVPSLER